ncbi:hypothetical protein DSLASN_42450 [Desulfoluna limicola]|uniref:Uncharacterized protein n=1 Tax=Desulfoluna limicola TaxID=2810562 RepID=A0ABM7PM68_9BACT|nr:hypothetical protein DSLASN_42450 [Desulfoluna limicola]
MLGEAFACVVALEEVKGLAAGGLAHGLRLLADRVSGLWLSFKEDNHFEPEGKGAAARGHAETQAQPSTD